MKEREEELDSVYSTDQGGCTSMEKYNKARSQPLCVKRQTSDVSVSQYYEKYYARQDFDPP